MKTTISGAPYSFQIPLLLGWNHEASLAKGLWVYVNTGPRQRPSSISLLQPTIQIQVDGHIQGGRAIPPLLT